MSENRLVNESSPYLLQHARQPVDWYPWGEEAFRRARELDRPVFLSIGYSTCHWCHVMARESFEDADIAALLNERFIAVKVDREERPDLDSVYMAVCQAMTGSGGWPLSLFLTPEQKPFFAGTYFPKDPVRGMPGFRQLLTAAAEKWETDRAALRSSAEKLQSAVSAPEPRSADGDGDADLLSRAAEQFRRSFDAEYGGFGSAPKFPMPHNLLFLLDRFRKAGDGTALRMAEVTLRRMYRGGLYDHIGFGFCRYSTDRAFLIPHFEKMLYDNALLLMAYVSAFDATDDRFYLRVAEEIADYVLREMTAPAGGFYSAQDADSDGVEGKFYALTPAEVYAVLGAARGARFCRCYDVTDRGNFQGKTVPHLVGTEQEAAELRDCLPALRAYRRERTALHLDDKILTAWNGLMIAALAQLARVTGSARYRDAAERGMAFLQAHMAEGDRLFVSARDGRRGCAGFLDDYACTIFALLALQQVTQEEGALVWAKQLCARAAAEFRDDANGGFFLSGDANEALILRPKQTYDGAMPSGNAVMAFVLQQLARREEDSPWAEPAERQLRFLSGAAASAPTGHTFFLLALSDALSPPDRVTVALAEGDDAAAVLRRLPLHAQVTILRAPTPAFPPVDGKTTYYVCTGSACLPPSHDPALLKNR